MGWRKREREGRGTGETLEENADRIPEREKGDRVCVDVGGVGESGDAAVG